MFDPGYLQALQTVRARAAGSLEAVIFVFLTQHEAGLDIGAGDWLRLRRAYHAHEDALVAVRDYLCKSELVQ